VNAYILAAKRTPIGAFMGLLSSVPAPRLGASVIQSLLQENPIPPQDIQECIMGQVLTAGSGQAPARQAAIYAQLPTSVPCLTINKVCGSGLKAIALACDAIALHRAEVIVAGGQESMSLSPHLLPSVRQGVRMGNRQLVDSMIRDGLWDPYHDFHMGKAGELCADTHHISRETQDEFAVQSYQKAQKAQSEHAFDKEITAIEVQVGKKQQKVHIDEEPGKVLFEKIPRLRPVFAEKGSITAANASKINDGASACLVVSEKYLKSLNQKPLARIVAHSVFAQEPELFTTAPIQAIKDCTQAAGVSVSNIDLFEINEAFSVVALVVAKELGISHKKLNIHGGAVALGHPIGASGARILTTLVHALHRHNKRYGLAGICLGGGEAIAMLLEKI